MDKILELKQKKARLIEEARESVTKTELENRSFTPEEKQKHDKIFDDVAKINDSIKIEETLRGHEESIKEVSEVRAGIILDADKGNKNTEAEKRAFNSFLRNGHNGLTNEEVRALSFGTDSEGGYTVAPSDFQAELIKQLQQECFLLNEVSVVRMAKAKTMDWPKLSSTPANADWVGEITAVTTDSAMAFGTFSLSAFLATKEAIASLRLLRDSAINIEQEIIDQLKYQFAATFEKAILTGNGSSKALGLFVASASGISTARDLALPTGNATDIVTSSAADTFTRARYRVKQGYLANAKWILNRETMEKVALLKDGQGNYILKPGLEPKANDTIRGHEVLLTDYAPNTYTANSYVALFGDLKQYKANIVNSFSIQRLDQLLARTNQVSFIGRMEGDGKPVLEEAFLRIKLSAS